ncbi:MAG: NB-ARC domain-containing protein, partial [Cyanobacteria bacterium J06592_8]
MAKSWQFIKAEIQNLVKNGELNPEIAQQILTLLDQPLDDINQLPERLRSILPQVNSQGQTFNQQGQKVKNQINVGGSVGVIVNLIQEKVEELKSIPQNLRRSGVIKFVGRDDALNTLHEQLQQTERVAISAVTGMGGIGKTELALQYGKQHWKEETYPGGICWLRVRDQDVGIQILDFAEIQLGITVPDEIKENRTLEQIIDYCWRNWPIPPNPPYQKSDVLLIFDDVSDYEAIENFLPSDPRFKILVTTRKQWLAESFQRLELKVLSESEALELLASFIGNRIKQEPEQAQLLCKDLGYLPLGLELVGRYLIRKSKLSLAEMRSRLSLAHNSLQKRDRKGEAFPDMTAQRGVEAAFELSWQELDKEEQEVACLLSLFALAPIEWEWVEQSLLEKDTEDLEEIRDDVLVNLSLLQDEGNKTYQFHPLIREFLKEKREKRVSVNEMKQEFCQTMVAIGKTIPETP